MLSLPTIDSSLTLDHLGQFQSGSADNPDPPVFTAPDSVDSITFLSVFNLVKSALNSSCNVIPFLIILNSSACT